MEASPRWEASAMLREKDWTVDMGTWTEEGREAVGLMTSCGFSVREGEEPGGNVVGSAWLEGSGEGSSDVEGGGRVMIGGVRSSTAVSLVACGIGSVNASAVSWMSGPPVGVLMVVRWSSTFLCRNWRPRVKGQEY